MISSKVTQNTCTEETKVDVSSSQSSSTAGQLTNLDSAIEMKKRLSLLAGTGAVGSFRLKKRPSIIQRRLSKLGGSEMNVNTIGDYSTD